MLHRHVALIAGVLTLAARCGHAMCVEKVPPWCAERGGSGVVVRVVGEQRSDALLSEILLALDEAHVLRRTRVPLDQNVCRTYQKALRMPGPPERCATRKLATRLNPGINLDRVGETEKVVVPDVQICLPEDRSTCTSNKPLPIYDLYVQMPPDKARKFARQPRWLREGKVAIDPYGPGAEKSRPGQSLPPITVPPYMTLPSGKQCELGSEAALVSMISRSTKALTARCTPQGARADRTLLSIVDHSQVAPHYDFDGQWPAGVVCDLVTNADDEDHATGLEGIIKARADERGLVGLYPDAEVVPFWWKSDTPGALTGMQVSSGFRVQPTERFKVTLFATDWDRIGEQGLTQFLENQIDDDPAVPEATRLWVAASGKPTTASDRILRDGSPLLPEGAGRQSNVLVVTGCDNCLDPTATLINDARSSPELVHVAAPGALVPTTARQRGYRQMAGTSAAVPFVGAMAALLADCYPMQLKSAAAIKERLQFTSRPLSAAKDANRLAAGIVDPDVAFLDPSHVHLKRHGAVGYEQIDGASWCRREITVLHPKTGEPSGDFAQFNSRFLDRIVRIDDGGESLWVFFRTSLNNAGAVQEGRVIRVGPGTFGPVLPAPPKKNENNNEPLIRITDGDVLSLSEIDDLVGKPRIASTMAPEPECAKK